MKLEKGRIYRAKGRNQFGHNGLLRDGWLWVYEGKNPLGWYMFKSVVTGDIESTRYPWRVFENWDEDNNN